MAPKVTLIVDTSTLIDDLKLVKRLAEEAERREMEILLPQETMLELDKIKDHYRLDGIGLEAREAIRWICKVLTDQDPRAYQSLRGQRQHEVLVEGLHGDASILDCALYNNRNTGRLTIMLSNDNNLLNRALIEGVETLNGKQVQSIEQVVTAISQRAEHVMDWNCEDADVEVDMDVAMGDPSEPPSEQLELPRKIQGKAGKPPREPPCDVPAPVKGANMQETITANLCNLLDWHLNRIHGEDLHFLQYRKPTDSKSIARILDRFKFDFMDIIPSSLLREFIEKIKTGVVDRSYVQVHVKLMQALCYNDRAYYSILK